MTRCKPYPGDDAAPCELLALAADWHAAALALARLCRTVKHGSQAPFRMAAFHAVELYLNAVLSHDGVQPKRLRTMGHDLEPRLKLALKSGLRLKRRTHEHLVFASRARAYLLDRYDVREASRREHLNRIEASLEEVARKATLRLREPESDTRSGPAVKEAG